jgi:hypothetical protein
MYVDTAYILSATVDGSQVQLYINGTLDKSATGSTTNQAYGKKVMNIFRINFPLAVSIGADATSKYFEGKLYA